MSAIRRKYTCGHVCRHVSQAPMGTLLQQLWGAELAPRRLARTFILEGDLQLSAVGCHLTVLNHKILLHNLGDP